MAELKKKKLSKMKIREYVKSNGSNCPYCGNDFLEGGDRELNNGVVSWRVTCKDCGRYWDELYKLHDIHEYDVEG